MKLVHEITFFLLEKFGGPLKMLRDPQVGRGSPVEKHCSKGTKLIQYCIMLALLKS